MFRGIWKVWVKPFPHGYVPTYEQVGISSQIGNHLIFLQYEYEKKQIIYLVPFDTAYL